VYSPKINLELTETFPDGGQQAPGRPKAARHQQQVYYFIFSLFVRGAIVSSFVLHHVFLNMV
jgi:hypothetical protein